MKKRKGTVIKLSDDWKVVSQLGSGGFGQVYRVAAGGKEAAVKLVPKLPGADRELLLATVGEAVNVIPVLETGETDSAWAILMPIAEESLRDKLNRQGKLPVDEAVSVLLDVAGALESLSGRIVHRDLKPENILLFDGKWCLTDFGIGRYLDATTSTATRRDALTAAYAAPERWRSERATAATDIYSLGVIAHELLSGRRPFDGPEFEDFREQHLRETPPSLEGLTSRVTGLVGECLYKASEARPSAANVLARLQQIDQVEMEGLKKLAAANLEEIHRRSDAQRKRSLELSERERRDELFESALVAYKELADTLSASIRTAAPAAEWQSMRGQGWSIRMGDAVMTLTGVQRTPEHPWNRSDPPAFDPIAHTSLTVEIPRDYSGYQGRSHSLWFCDAVDEKLFAWYETAFMISPMIPRTSAVRPFALPPGEDAAMALWVGLATYQVAWPFERLEPGCFEAFIDRWGGWFAEAALGTMAAPGRMPEREIRGSWRRQ